jgi:hypothetical protein
MSGWAEQLRIHERRDLASAGQPRGWLATFVVAVAMVGIAGLGFAASNLARSAPARPIPVADGVTVTPLEGWEFAGRSGDGSEVLLTQGAGSLDVLVVRGGRIARVLSELVLDWTEGGYVTFAPFERIEAQPGRYGVRAAYSGTFDGIAYPLEGQITGIQGADVVVLFDGWAGVGEYGLVRPQIEQMIREATIP